MIKKMVNVEDYYGKWFEVNIPYLVDFYGRLVFFGIYVPYMDPKLVSLLGLDFSLGPVSESLQPAALRLYRIRGTGSRILHAESLDGSEIRLGITS